VRLGHGQRPRAAPRRPDRAVRLGQHVGRDEQDVGMTDEPKAT
jgi:hypothetical protein